MSRVEPDIEACAKAQACDSSGFRPITGPSPPGRILYISIVQSCPQLFTLVF
jgi:hypothetical protein